MSPSVKNGIFLIIIFFASLFVYTRFFGPITFSVKSNQNEIPFQTTGTGEVTGIPDKASVSLGVNSHATSSDEARSLANNVINSVVRDLKALGIKETDIKTTNFSVYEDPQEQPLPYNSSGQAPTPTITSQVVFGFTATADIEVKTSSVDLANKAIDIASKDGANAIGGVNFTFDDAKQKDLENQARIKAVADARQKAQALAKAAGIRLGRVTNISEDNFGGPVPMAANAKSGRGVSDSTNLNPGESKVTINVTLTFETN